MADYRLRLLDAKGAVFATSDIEAQTTAAAIERARHRGGERVFSFELWQGGSLVHTERVSHPVPRHRNPNPQAVGSILLGMDSSRDQGADDPEHLRILAVWYREFAERTENPAIWERRLATAEDLESHADKLEQTKA